MSQQIEDPEHSNFHVEFVSSPFTFSAITGVILAPHPEDGQVIYACAGYDATFPWSYTLSPGEHILSIGWLFRGSSEEMVANFSHGVFVHQPDFAHRVQQVANGGLALSQVTVADAGNYSVEINSRDRSGASVTVLHNIVLRIVDSGRLHSIFYTVGRGGWGAKNAPFAHKPTLVVMKKIIYLLIPVAFLRPVSLFQSLT